MILAIIMANISGMETMSTRSAQVAALNPCVDSVKGTRNSSVSVRVN